MDEKKMVAYGTAIGMGAVSTIIYLVVNKFGTNPIRKAVAKLRASGKVSPKAALAILAAITSITLPSLVNRGKADAPGTEKFIRDLTRIILNAVPFMFWKEFVHELGLDAQGNPATNAVARTLANTTQTNLNGAGQSMFVPTTYQEPMAGQYQLNGGAQMEDMSTHSMIDSSQLAGPGVSGNESDLFVDSSLLAA